MTDKADGRSRSSSARYAVLILTVLAIGSGMSSSFQALVSMFAERNWAQQRTAPGEGILNGKVWHRSMIEVIQKYAKPDNKLYYWYPDGVYGDEGINWMLLEASYFVYPCRLYARNESLLSTSDYVIMLAPWEKSFTRRLAELGLAGSYTRVYVDKEHAVFARRTASSQP